MKKILALAFIFTMTLFNTGCATLADAQAAKGSGKSKVYDQPYDVVWSAVLDAVKSSELALVSENKEKGSILAQRGITAFSLGEDVAIFVESIDGKVKTRVEVVNKRAIATNITAADWESRLFGALDKKLL